jgi:hypothetical protein
VNDRRPKFPEVRPLKIHVGASVQQHLHGIQRYARITVIVARDDADERRGAYIVPRWGKFIWVCSTVKEQFQNRVPLDSRFN